MHKDGNVERFTHLDKKHCITSSKIMATNKKLADIKKQLDLSDLTFKKDLKRWFEVQLGACFAEQSISYNVFTTCKWQLIGRQLPVATPLWPSVGVKPNTWKKLEVGSLPGLPNVQSSTARGKTPRIGVFLVSLERS